MPDLVYAPIPYGIILKWSGTLASIPYGFQLCDGTNNTPDLRAKFVKGVPNGSTNPGSTGGSDSVTLTTSQIPSHNHSVTDPQHTHTFPFGGAASTGGTGVIHNTATTTVHGQATSANSAGISVNNTGGGCSHENRPAYYQVAFIMKIVDN